MDELKRDNIMLPINNFGNLDYDKNIEIEKVTDYLDIVHREGHTVLFLLLRSSSEKCQYSILAFCRIARIIKNVNAIKLQKIKIQKY